MAVGGGSSNDDAFFDLASAQQDLDEIIEALTRAQRLEAALETILWREDNHTERYEQFVTARSKAMELRNAIWFWRQGRLQLGSEQ